MRNSGKPWPSLRSDEEAERFVEEANLSKYDWSVATATKYEVEATTVRFTTPKSSIRPAGRQTGESEPK